jgi:hypothetical protein
LRLDDWNAKTIPLFLEYLKRFKETVDSFNQQSSQSSISSDEYRITFVDETGKEITKSFAKVDYSSRAKLLLNAVRMPLMRWVSLYPNKKNVKSSLICWKNSAKGERYDNNCLF